MQYRLLSRSTLLPVVAAMAMTYSSAALAQLGGAFDPGSMVRRGTEQAPDTTKPVVVPPPALPGATSTAAVAPATKIPTDMAPNDALFDAINRGDIGAARDALNRGAEMSARNILGMTPLELSVDLARNDISFLLLSFHESDTPKGPPAATAAKAAKPAASGKAAVASRASGAPVVAVKAVDPPAPPRTPRLFADDGGTPVPNDGFLGFNAGRPTH